MDHPTPNPEPTGNNKPRVVERSVSMTIESLLPAADANQLLELIAQGHNADDLHQLISQTNKAA